MKWEDVYKCNEIGEIGTEFASPPFTRNGDSIAIRPGSLYTSEMQKVFDYALKNGFISIEWFLKSEVRWGTLNSVAGHAFALMYTQPDNYLWSIRNLWGIESVDGVLEIPNNRSITGIIDFRLVNPGHARDFLR